MVPFLDLARSGAGRRDAFRAALDRMAEQGRLQTYTAPADPALEIAGIMKKLDGGPAILFSNVKGHDVPVVGVARSGWDLARWLPKTAQRVASAGSVYWFDQFEGDAGKLANWVAGGLWPDNVTMQSDQTQRRAEGFNNALLGHWS